MMAGKVLNTGELDSIRLDRGETVRAKPRRGTSVGQRVRVMIRPENVSVRDGAPPAGVDCVRGTVEGSIILGNVVRHHVCLSDGSEMTCIELNRSHRPAPAAGTAVELWWRPEDAVDLPVDTQD